MGSFCASFSGELVAKTLDGDEFGLAIDATEAGNRW